MDVRHAQAAAVASDQFGAISSKQLDGIRCLKAERLILDSPLFNFDQEETENAIDSAIRLRLVSEQRLRTKVIDRHREGINGGRILLDALVDTGGQSRLERWFLKLVRTAGLPRPELQLSWRDGSRIIARVDAFFPGGLIVEVAGHGTHSSRRAIQADEQRRTELTLRGFRVITFTYNDIRDRPDWVIAKLLQAITLTASACNPHRLRFDVEMRSARPMMRYSAAVRAAAGAAAELVGDPAELVAAAGGELAFENDPGGDHRKEGCERQPGADLQGRDRDGERDDEGDDRPRQAAAGDAVVGAGLDLEREGGIGLQLLFDLPKNPLFLFGERHQRSPCTCDPEPRGRG